jgi:tetratricopeptide (TPR) repeat protein
MKKTITAFLVMFLVSVSGCIPALQKPEVVISESETRPTSLPPLNLLDRRIEVLNAILQTEGVSEKDKEIASTLLESYKTLKVAYSGNLTNVEYRNVINTLFKMLSALDENYFSEQRGVLDYSGPMNLFSIKRKKIMDAYFAGDYKGVISQCLELKSVFGPEALIPEIGLVFALSLGKQGMPKDAIEIGEGIALEMEATPDIIHLRAKIAEWHLNLGQREKALNMYDKLTDNLDERQGILKGLTRKIGGKSESEPPSDITTGVQDLSPMDELLLKVDALMQKHLFDEARLLLIKHRIRLEDGPDAEIIDEALKEIEIAEERFEKEKRSEDTYTNETIETAKKLIEEESFEEAIVKIDELQDLRGPGSESTALKNQAIEKLINRERNRAAKLFLAAKKTQDRAKKEEYLLSSYKLLKAMIDKYPSSPLNIKLKSHMKTLTGEMESLGITPEN